MLLKFTKAVFQQLKREWSERLLEDFKNIFMALKSCEVMNKTAYKKCWSSVGHKLWPLKYLNFYKKFIELKCFRYNDFNSRVIIQNWFECKRTQLYIMHINSMNPYWNSDIWVVWVVITYNLLKVSIFYMPFCSSFTWL